jgi:MYXO-CTERM domain-containing protein
MSAAEMTMDPAFDFNPDLKDVSNIHMANRIMECNGTTTSDPNLMPWRVVLPQGDTVRGTMVGTWPIKVDDQPAALKILQYGKSGQGKVVEDQSAKITQMLKQQNGGATTGTAASTGGKSGTTGSGGTSASSGSAGKSSANTGSSGSSGGTTIKDSGGCAVTASSPSSSLSLLLLALAALFTRRKR